MYRLKLILVGAALVACTPMQSSKELVYGKYMLTFFDIHEWHCSKPYSNYNALREDIENNTKLRLSKEFSDVYEIIIEDISFAVSPEEEGCTTDVLLTHAGKINPIIKLNEVDTFLQNKGYKKQRTDTHYHEGLDGTQVKTTIIDYISPLNEKVELDYPIEKQSNYYMTLFVKKFKKTS